MANCLAATSHNKKQCWLNILGMNCRTNSIVHLMKIHNTLHLKVTSETLIFDTLQMFPRGQWPFYMMTSSNGKFFRVTGHLCGEFTGLRWTPRTKASDAELWCAWMDDWLNNGEAGDLRRLRPHYDVTVMIKSSRTLNCTDTPRPRTTCLHHWVEIYHNVSLAVWINWHRGPLCDWHGITERLACILNAIHYFLWSVIFRTYPNLVGRLATLCFLFDRYLVALIWVTNYKHINDYLPLLM